MRITRRGLIITIVILLIYQLFSYFKIRSLIDKHMEQIYEENHPASKITVYVTTHGEKYHSGACRYLHSSKHSISLRRAVLNGFSDCSVCSTPKYVAEYDAIDTWDEYVNSGNLEILYSEHYLDFIIPVAVVPVFLFLFISLFLCYFKKDSTDI